MLQMILLVMLVLALSGCRSGGPGAESQKAQAEAQSKQAYQECLDKYCQPVEGENVGGIAATVLQLDRIEKCGKCSSL